MNEPDKLDKASAEAGEPKNLLDQVALDVAPRMTGMVLGTLTRLDAEGRPFVTFPGAADDIAAATTAVLDVAAVGARVALMFAGGEARQPVIMGVLQEPSPSAARTVDVRLEGERLVLEGRREVELRCGKASILLKENGKVVVKGTHIVSRSSGANKIKGASIALN